MTRVKQALDRYRPSAYASLAMATPALGASQRWYRRPLSIALALMLGAAYHWVTDPSQPARPAASPKALLDKLLVKSGLGIAQVSIAGQHFTSDDDIWEAAWLDEPQSLVAFDLFAAENRIHNLPWIASVHITRRPPDGLDIRVGERTPFAVWRHDGAAKAAAVGVASAHLIDASGRVLAPVGKGQGRGLPVVSGEGAAGAAAALMSLLQFYPDVRQRLVSAERVSGLRWTLRLVDGVEILLPAQNSAAALDRLSELATAHRLFERDIVSVDLRSANQTTVRTVQHLLRPHKPEQRPRQPLLSGGEAGARAG